MAASHNDRYVLSTDGAFRNRVRSSLLIYCATVVGENPSQTAMGRERRSRAVQAINAPDTYAVLYTNAAACDATVLSDATGAGAVALDATNVAARALLVTDAHIDSAVLTQFNFFIAPQ